MNYTENLNKETIRLPDASYIPAVYFQLATKSQSDEVLSVSSLITQLGCKVHPLEITPIASKLSQNEVRYFSIADEIFAKKIQGILLEQGIITVLNYKADLLYKAPTGLIEVWLR